MSETMRIDRRCALPHVPWMRVPNATRAVIDRRKLHEYLLSPRHPIGRFKAAFFRSLGYSLEQWPQLEADLRRQLLSEESALEASNPYGQKYSIRGTLVGPSGVSAVVVSVWVVRAGEDYPRFVTAYPEVGR